MVSTLQLLQNQRAAVTLFTIGSLILLFSSTLEINIETERETKGVEIEVHPTPAQITLFAFCLFAFGGFISSIVATIRLNQLKQQVYAGQKPNSSLEPSLWIFGGSWVLFAGVIALIIGTKQSVEAEQEIAIF